jgi:hypothetical protein
MELGFLDKLPDVRTLKNVSVFYGTRRFVTMSVRALHMFLSGAKCPYQCIISLLINSVVRVRKKTIPTERPQLVGEVRANVLRIEGATWSAWRIPTVVISARFSRPEPLFFLSSSSSIILMRLSGPRSRPTTSQKIW